LVEWNCDFSNSPWPARSIDVISVGSSFFIHPTVFVPLHCFNLWILRPDWKGLCIKSGMKDATTSHLGKGTDKITYGLSCG
jgi:hypothetical protein